MDVRRKATQSSSKNEFNIRFSIEKHLTLNYFSSLMIDWQNCIDLCAPWMMFHSPSFAFFITWTVIIGHECKPMRWRSDSNSFFFNHQSISFWIENEYRKDNDFSIKPFSKGNRVDFSRNSNRRINYWRSEQNSEPFDNSDFIWLFITIGNFMLHLIEFLFSW